MLHFACDGAEHNAPQSFVPSDYAEAVPYSTPRHTRRRENLRLLCHEAGGVSQLEMLIGTPKSHISAILHGRRGVGDQLAAKIERHMGKPVGWLDEPHAGALEHEAIPDHGGAAEILEVSAQGWDMLVDFEQLPPAQRKEIAQLVRERADAWRRLAAEVLQTYTPAAPEPGGVALPPQVRPADEHVHRIVRLPDHKSEDDDKR